MREIQIITDSCADFDSSYSKKYDIGCINFSILMDQKELEIGIGYNHKVKISTVFDALQEGKRLHTLPATEYEIEKKLRKYLDMDKDILYIGCCNKQSTTVTKVNKIAKKLSHEYDNRIEVIDSLNAGAGQGLLVIKACELLEQGKTFDEIKEAIYRLRKTVIQFATPESLSFMYKANKISSSSAIIGNILDIKPIIISDKNGLQYSIKQVRGRDRSLKEIVRLFKESVIAPEDQTIVIIHGDDIESAEYVKSLLLQDDFVCKDIHMLCIGPAVGITMGPGMVGLFGFGKLVEVEG